MSLRVDVVTQEEQLVSAEVDEVTLPAVDGEISVLPGHESLMTLMKAGEVVLRTQGKSERVIVSPGFIQVTRDAVIVLADSAVREDDLDEAKAKQAKAEAEAAIQKLQNDSEIAMTLGTIERTLIELRAIERRRKHSR
jgi:F-type H+-transporting ATPase subunit epsilon